MPASDVALIIQALTPLFVAIFGIWLKNHMQNKEDAALIIGATDRAAGQIITGLAASGKTVQDHSAYRSLLTKGVEYVHSSVPDAVRRKHKDDEGIADIIEGHVGNKLDTSKVTS